MRKSPPALDSDVLGHLCFAATAVETCWVEVGPERLPGRFGYPDADAGSLPVWLDRDAAALPVVPSPGTPIRVSYELQGSPCGWSSTVTRPVEPTSLRCGLPERIERLERRAAARARVLGDPGFALEIRQSGETSPPVTLVDVSTGGVALLARAGAVRQGERVLARLHIAAGEPIRLVLEAMALRAGPQGEALVGCRFASITDHNRRRIAEVVYGLLRTDR